MVLAAVSLGAFWRWKSQGPKTVVRPAQDASPAEMAAGYLGVQGCRECHAERVEEYCHTSHFLAMRMPAADSILGSFAEGENQFATRDRKLTYELTAEQDGFYQSAVWQTPAGPQRIRERIDLVMGSGKIAQSLFYWRGDKLFQLPIGYNVPFRGWANNPGFPDGRPRFDRAIGPRCLECHSTYFHHVWGTDNQYVKDRIIPEISCERCHGPGADHVAAHRRQPSSAKPLSIVRPQQLSRDRQIDLCAQCHSDPGEPIKPSFTYRPGEVLAEYIDLSLNKNVHNTLDSVGVADQVTPLRDSRCFQGSAMTCITCHSPHVQERGKVELFSSRCQTCHQAEHCGMFPQLGERAKQDCIHCHMPRTGDDQTLWQTARAEGVALIENYNHRIGVYTEATDRQLLKLWKDDGDEAHQAEMLRRSASIADISAARVRERLEIGRPAQAEQIARSALEIAPQQAVLWHLLGRALADQGRLDDAVTALLRAIELDNKPPEPYLDAATALNALDRPDEALKQYQTLLAVDPQHKSAQLKLIWMLACDPFARIRSGGQALRQAEALIAQVGEEDIDALDAWAAALAESGNFVRAAAVAGKARALAEAQGDSARADGIGQRQALYDKQRPWRKRAAQ